MRCASSCELLPLVMQAQSSAIVTTRVPTLTGGTVLALLAVVSFSFSFPATAWALDGFGAWSAAGVRGALAALLAAAALLATRAPVPPRAAWPALAVVAGGCVVGFPILTTLALQTSSTAHSAVVIGALPMATAAFAALRTGHRPSRRFWAAAGVGGATVIAFALVQHHGRPSVADLYLFAALVVCAA